MVTSQVASALARRATGVAQRRRARARARRVLEERLIGEPAFAPWKAPSNAPDTEVDEADA